MKFRSPQQVDAFVQEKGIGALGELVHSPGALDSTARSLAVAFLEQRSRGQRAVEAAQAAARQRDVEDRFLRAAEQSADAAQRSALAAAESMQISKEAANAAKDSVRTAKWAIAVALLGALVAAWQYMPWAR